MAICLDLFLAADRYDAGGGQDPRTAEWPPHPARAISAMRSVATDEEAAALRALERLSPPRVHASGLASTSRSRTYVVTNRRAAGGGNLNHPGRTSGLRERSSVFPLSPRVQMVWTHEDLGDDIVDMLDCVARRVPYIGRSTSFVLMGIRRVQDLTVPEPLELYEPVTNGSGDHRLRVAYPGYIDELEALYQDGAPAWQASDGVAHPYRCVAAIDGSRAASVDFESPYRDLMVLRFRDHQPAGSLTPMFTAALRSLVMGQTSEPLPPALHGHGFEGRPHVAYLGLPVCGHKHADGHLVALAVAIPGMDETDRRRILRGILGPDAAGSVELRVPGFRGPFTLEYRPDDARPRAATAAHWLRPSRQWVTATPIVLDRYPKNRDLAQGVAHSVRLAGLPDPVTIDVSSAALTTGGVQLSPRELPKRAQGRLYCHARIRFEQLVSGPVLAGAGRYFGVGLFLPERDR